MGGDSGPPDERDHKVVLHHDVVHQDRDFRPPLGGGGCLSNCSSNSSYSATQERGNCCRATGSRASAWCRRSNRTDTPRGPSCRRRSCTSERRHRTSSTCPDSPGRCRRTRPPRCHGGSSPRRSVPTSPGSAPGCPDGPSWSSSGTGSRCAPRLSPAPRPRRGSNPPRPECGSPRQGSASCTPRSPSIRISPARAGCCR